MSFYLIRVHSTFLTFIFILKGLTRLTGCLLERGVKVPRRRIRESYGKVIGALGFPARKRILGENISSERHYPYGILTGTTPSSGKVNELFF